MSKSIFLTQNHQNYLFYPQNLQKLKLAFKEK